MAKNKFYLYEKANKKKDSTGGYSFFIEGDFLEKAQKVTFVCLERDKDNKRINMARFFVEYRKLRAIISIIENKLKSGGKNATYKLSLFGGEDAKRRMVIAIKDGTIWFNFDDKKIQSEIKECKDYSGEVKFFIKDSLDMMEFFDINTTLTNWELANIKTLLTYDTKTSKTS